MGVETSVKTVEISVKEENYLDISLNALQAIGTATRKEQTSAHA